MNKKKIISLVLGCMSLLPASAQNGWFVDVGGGVQTIFSSDASKLDFGKRLTPSYTIGVGKWITPAYALRLQIGGYSLNGMSTSEGLYLRDPQTNGSVYGPNDPVIDNVTVRPDGTYRHYLRYVNAHADFMVSLSRLLFRSQGRFDVLPAGWRRADNLLERCQQVGFRQAPHSVIHHWRGQVDNSRLCPSPADRRVFA